MNTQTREMDIELNNQPHTFEVEYVCHYTREYIDGEFWGAPVHEDYLALDDIELYTCILKTANAERKLEVESLSARVSDAIYAKLWEYEG